MHVSRYQALRLTAQLTKQEPDKCLIFTLFHILLFLLTYFAHINDTSNSTSLLFSFKWFVSIYDLSSLATDSQKKKKKLQIIASRSFVIACLAYYGQT